MKARPRAGHPDSMNILAPSPAKLAALSLLTLSLGCSSRAVVGVDDEVLPGGECQGPCPAPLYADAIFAPTSSLLDIEPTPEGGVVVAGHFAGKLQLADSAVQSQPDTADMFVMKRSAAGDVEWVRSVAGYAPSLQVAARPDGTIVVAGCFQDTADFGTGPITAGGPPDYFEAPVDFFLWTIAADGTPSAPVTLPAELCIAELALASNGDAILAATLPQAIQLGGQILAPVGSTDGLVVRMTTSGDIVFARQTSAPGDDAFVDLAPRPDGGVVIAVAYSEAFTFEGNVFPKVGPTGGAILALDEKGSALWGHRIDPTPDDADDSESSFAPSLALAPDNRVAVWIERQPDAVENALQVFDSIGTLTSHTSVGAVSPPPTGFAMGSDGAAYIAGSFRKSVIAGDLSIDTADPDDLDDPGDHDGYLARIGTKGQVEWLLSMGAPVSHQQLMGLTVTTLGAPVVRGEYYKGAFAIGDDLLPAAVNPSRAFVAAFTP
ncbi:MAG: hypothetical protein R3B70_00640 [Polyangiaceae bacterium]